MASLRKRCPYLELFWSAFSRIRTEYWNMQTRITSNIDTFHAVIPRKMKSKFTLSVNKRLYPTESNACKLYGNAKLHKLHKLYSGPKSISELCYLISLLNDSRNYISSIRYRVFGICFPWYSVIQLIRQFSLSEGPGFHK